MTWTYFIKLFKVEYKTIDMTNLRAQEFINYTQRTSLVKEHSTKFNALAYYTLGMASTKLGKMEKFIRRLNLAITYDEMMRSTPP